MIGTHPIISLSQVFFLVLILFHLTPVLPVLSGEPPKNPILCLETGMHTTRIRRISVDTDNRFLVTGSTDKTVRLWELPNGRLIKTLRPPIGEGHEGRIYAVAISPDGKTIAAAGWTGWGWEEKDTIYLFDRESGRMTRPKGLQGLSNVVFHLAYSKDGRFLVATLGDTGGIRIYRTSDYTLVKEDTKYGNGGSFSADFSRDGRLVTASVDGFIRLYDKSFMLTKKVQGLAGKQPFSVSFSPDGTKIAVGFYETTRVDVLSGKDLSYLSSPDTSGADKRGLSVVAWSSDGTLYAAPVYGREDLFPILKWTEGGKGRYKELLASSSTIMDIQPLKNGAVAFGTGDPAFGIFDRDGNRTLYRGPEIGYFGENPKGFFVSRDGATVQFGFEAWGKSPARFSIANRLLTLAPSEPGALKPPVTEAEGLKITDWDYELEPKLNEKPLKLHKDERSRSFAVCPDGQSFLLGTEWNLWLFDRGGAEKWPQPTQIPAIAHLINIAGDGKVAVAALSDGTIRWYRMKDGKELLALFLPKDQDRKRWVLWTPSGYYDASPGGEDLIGWHVNNGKDQAADFFLVSRFRSSYYRPDIIEEVLKILDLDEAVKLADIKAGIKERARAVREILPPVVEIISPADNSRVLTKPMIIRYRVRSPTGDPVTGIRVFIDGGLSKEERGLNLAGVDIVREIQVGLPEKDCEIGIVAKNRHGWGATAKSQIMWIGPKDEKKGVLFVLAIGVSNYKDDKLKMGVKRAAKDALDFSELMKKQKRGRLYRDVQVTVLSDEQATRDSIITALREIGGQATGNDLIMLFLSGHGEKDHFGKYRFLLADADKKRLPSRCLSHSDIKDPLVGFPGRRVIFIDTCRSGSIIDVIGLANELASSENGRIIVFTSATGNQNSIEPSGASNGAFTMALLKGLTGKAAGEQRKVTVSRLRVYIEEEVPRLTNNLQKPDFVDLGGGALELAEVIN